MSCTDSPNTETVTTTLDTPSNSGPFALLTGSAILGGWLVAGFLSEVITLVVWPHGGSRNSLPLAEPVSSMFCNGIFLLLVAGMVRNSKLSPSKLLGPLPAWPILGKYALLVVPLLLLSVASIFLLYLPLSYVLPGFVKWWLLDSPRTLIWRSGPGYDLANVLNFCTIVLVTPVLEEFAFRGLLLTRWSLKWNVPRAILWSSVLFAGLHANIIGSFFVGYVLAVIYIRTGSLFVPIVVHAANNLIAWLIGGGVELFLGAPEEPTTLAAWQAQWWVGLLAALIVTPWVFKFTRDNIPKTSWRMPYLSADTTQCGNSGAS